MRLKRLETYGFKSFADRMVFDFEDGITAIIGPNGSGKSNVVDAIKWVIGEQSAKSLRGNEMADVIFSGCASRRPMALAEVTLVLDGIGLAKGLPEDEIGLTRRLTGDGHSSYYINGKQVRLRDIRELLMDTGMGTSAYAVIEQGRISFILEASAKDRRAILEEAAGISRYKAHRRQAARRLERSRLDCERIGQVLAEVEKRLRTVTRQAESARRYKELEARLRDLRMVFALEEWGRLTDEGAGLEERRQELSQTEAGLTAGLADLDVELTEGETSLTAFEDELLQAEQGRADAQSARDVAASRIRDAEARLVELEGQEAEDSAGITAAEARIEALTAERREAEAALAATDSEGDDRAAQLYEAKRSELEACAAELAEATAGDEEFENQRVECLQELSRIEAERKRLTTARSGLGERRHRLEQRRAEHGRALLDSDATEEECRAQVGRLESELEAVQTGLADRIRAREGFQAAVTGCEHDLHELDKRIGQAEVRRNLLNQYEERAEGIYRGVRSVLEQGERLPGILGLVADHCRVPAPYETAIEYALGGAAQNLIAETAEAAEQAIAWLREGRRGRATFLPLDEVEPRRLDPAIYAGAEGVVGVAHELIGYEERFAPVFRHLLGNILVLEDLERAVALRRSGLRARMVTLAGDIVTPGGAMTGGQRGGDAGGGIVSRKNEIARLGEELSGLEARRQELARALDAAREEAFTGATAVEEQRRTLAGVEQRLAQARTAQAKAEQDSQHRREAAAGFEREAGEIEQELLGVENEEIDLGGQREWFTAMRERLDQQLQARRSAIASLHERRDRLQEEVGNLRVDMATSEERRESVQNHLAHLGAAVTGAEKDLAERRDRLASLGERHEALRAQLAEDREAHAVDAAGFEHLAAGLQKTAGQRDALRDTIEGQRAEVRRRNGQLRTVEGQLQELALKLNEIAVRKEDMRQRILEDFALDLAEAFANWERPADLNLPTVRRELDETETAIKRLGSVNLTAIDELEVVKAREEFLSRQYHDLTEAADRLDQIITGIDDTCRKLFRDTYRSVRTNFQELFRKLFGGGRADLVLETAEGEDILEAGIEIIAQPPAKQPKSISLLSGGEKALSAIALLFAVYRSKPSPFCVLDEVDAPLDESNTDIYCHMLREFCEHSQFLVITHNKRSMQYADALYGITHAEPGVSTKISVKLQELDGATDPVETMQHQGPYGD